MEIIKGQTKDLIRKLLIAIAVLLVVGLVIGTFFDLQIASSIYTPGQPIAQIFSAIGLLPLGVPVCIILGAIGQRMAAGNYAGWKKVLAWLGIVALGLVVGILTAKPFLTLDGIGPLLPFEVSKVVIYVVGILMFAVLAILGFRAAKNNDEDALLRHLLLALALLAVAFLFVEVVKNLMHRPRYRALALGLEGIEFCPWYKPYAQASEMIQRYGLESDAFKSFPSGHSVQVGLTLVSFYGLASLFGSLRTDKAWRVAIVLQVVLLVCVLASRMVLGAHFVSDVSVGACVGVLAGIFLYTRANIS